MRGRPPTKGNGRVTPLPNSLFEASSLSSLDSLTSDSSRFQSRQSGNPFFILLVAVSGTIIHRNAEIAWIVGMGRPRRGAESGSVSHGLNSTKGSGHVFTSHFDVVFAVVCTATLGRPPLVPPWTGGGMRAEPIRRWGHRDAQTPPPRSPRGRGEGIAQSATTAVSSSATA